jgi:predicted enzyme related to lactoylglutathione lyase
MLTLGSVVLGVDDIDRAKAFWMSALGWQPTSPGDETWVILQATDGSGRRLSLGLSDSPVQQHPRIHLDLYADDQRAEIERLLALGASEVDWDLYPQDPDFVVLADTEGNRFCVIGKSE